MIVCELEKDCCCSCCFQSLRHVWLLATPWTTSCQASLPFTISWSLLKLMSIESVIPPSHLMISVVPFFCLHSFPADIRVFSNESAVFSNESALPIRWPKYWSFNISLSNEYSGLISFRISFRFDWVDLAVQGTLKSLLQHHSSKASVHQHSAFFMVHLSHPYLTTGKTIAFTIWTFVGEVMSLLFNMQSRFVKTFLPRSRSLLIHGCNYHL